MAEREAETNFIEPIRYFFLAVKLHCPVVEFTRNDLTIIPERHLRLVLNIVFTSYSF